MPAATRGTVPVTRPDTRAAIVLVARDGGEGPSYPLADTTDIGRTEGKVLLSDDRYISPRHARISFRGGSYFLRDLGSTNGLFVRIPFPVPAPHAGAPEHLPENRAKDPAKHRAKDSAKDREDDADPEQPLKDQDLFLVGQQVLRFEVVKDAEEGFGVASDNGTLLFGTPSTPRYARLSQRTVEGVVRDVFNIRKVETVLGRESGDIVFTDDPFLSRRHAVLRVHVDPAPRKEDAQPPPRRFTLTDLGSSNGTFLRVDEEVRLRHGDHFRIGQQLFRFDETHL